MIPTVMQRATHRGFGPKGIDMILHQQVRHRKADLVVLTTMVVRPDMPRTEFLRMGLKILYHAKKNNQNSNETFQETRRSGRTKGYHNWPFSSQIRNCIFKLQVCCVE